jgi:ABC-type branched-subunit amino acid transport system ATPase component
MSILLVEGLTAGYGAQNVLFDVNASINPGEIVSVIGPNGAGKSTLLKVIAGVLKPKSGDICYKNTSLLGMSPRHISAMGMSWVPQEENIFSNMTVLENLEMGAYLLRRSIRDRIDEVCEVFPQLKDRMGQLAGSLSGGQRQMLAVARGLVIRPELLLLDEPTAGLAPNLVLMMLDKIREIKERMGNSVLLVTQTLDAVRLSDRGYLLAAGKMKLEEETESFLANSEVKDLYFGG